MAIIELHPREVAPEHGGRVGQGLGWPWCQLRLCFERNWNHGKPLKDLSRRMVGSGLHSKKSFWPQIGDSIVGREWEQVASEEAVAGSR